MIDFNNLSQAQKLSMVLVASVIVAAAIYAIYAVLNPAQVLIYEDSSLEQVSKVTEQLELQGIEYQLDALGTGVMVNDEQANNVRVKLAGSNATEGTSNGFELFDNVDYSMTEQAQKVTYQRALQGELERTLSAYNEIDQARVHIMIPERKLFSMEQAKAKASVSLIMLPGTELTTEKISGIQALVSASVEGLAEKSVVVLNGEGIKISDNDSGEQFPGKPRAKGQLLLEQQLTEKALTLMSLYFSPDQVAVSVSVELDHTQTKQVKQELLGDSEERGYVTRKKESLTPRKASKDEPKPAPNKQSEVEYRHGSNTEEVVSYAGALKKLNVAIAILADIEPEQLVKLRQLVIAGLGVDTLRGDNLSVESFKPKKPATVATVFTPTEVTTAERPELVFEPKPVSTAPLENNQITILSGAIFALLVVLLLMFSAFRRKSLTQHQKDAALLQFNQWVNQSKVEHNAN